MNWTDSPLRLFLVKTIDRAFPTEPRALKHLIAIGIFVLCVAIAAGGSQHLGWITNGQYWINHLLFGIGLPLGLYGATTSMRAGVLVTFAWSLGNELWEDQLTRASFDVDWSHLGADIAGIAASLLIWSLLQRMGPANQKEAHTPCL